MNKAEGKNIDATSTRNFASCFFSPALLLSFLRCGDGQTLVHVAMEQPENVTACQEPWKQKATIKSDTLVSIKQGNKNSFGLLSALMIF